MLVFEVVIALLLGGAALAALARRIGTPYPALVALAGAALAIVPGTPTLVLNPELALALFVAPVLLNAAFDASPRDLRANWRVVTGLAFGAVGLTIVAVALVARMIVPEMSWAVAIALGAIIAPPDAAAATAVLQQLRPPHRLLVILEGESLFNDASALLIYRFAVAAAVSGFVVGWNIVPALAFVTVGSFLMGWGLARLTLLLSRFITDVATAVILQFGATFAVWLLAERLHLSGILTTVIFAMVAARHASGVTPARLRVPAYAVWEVTVFVLNVLAFTLIGFQLKSIVDRLDRSAWHEYLWFAGMVCVATIAARIAWVTGVAAASRWRSRSAAEARASAGAPHAQDAVGLSPRAAAVVGWCGMRGIVTLAAALALPTGSEGVPAFPYRDLILFTAFAVVLVTLVVQGMTLRPLLMLLKLENDDTVEREVRLARVETLRAALIATDHAADAGSPAAAIVRKRYALRLRRAELAVDAAAANAANAGASGGAAIAAADADENGEAARSQAILRAAVHAERARLLHLRSAGTIGDAAFQVVEQELDWEELDTGAEQS